MTIPTSPPSRSAHSSSVSASRLSERTSPVLFPAHIPTSRFVFSVLAQIYYFKPQTLSVSNLFLLVLSYWFGNAMHILLPSNGIFRWINPGPFNSAFRSLLNLIYRLSSL